MSLLTVCPTDIQNLVDEFVGHPYVVGSEPISYFYDKEGIAGDGCCVWSWTRDCGYPLDQKLWLGDPDYYEVVEVHGNTIGLQPYYYNDRNERINRPVLQRQVHETIEEDGFCSYWVVLREPVNSGGFGPCFDDEGRFCPIELLIFSERCCEDRMLQVYFEI